MSTLKLLSALMVFAAIAWFVHGVVASDEESQSSSANPQPQIPDLSEPSSTLTATPALARSHGLARSNFIPANWDGHRPQQEPTSDASWSERKLMDKFREEGFRGIGNSSILLSPNSRPNQPSKKPQPKREKRR